ncbi:hypothetical protein TNCV_2867001 [Trichonephila clavipes]|nr:hypothetical protein TNCV_2867001 [Trichonephila clavipes]
MIDPSSRYSRPIVLLSTSCNDYGSPISTNIVKCWDNEHSFVQEVQGERSQIATVGSADDVYNEVGIYSQVKNRSQKIIEAPLDTQEIPGTKYNSRK